MNTEALRVSPASQPGTAALLTYVDAGAALGVSPDRVRVLARIGSLKLVDLGYRTKRVTRLSVERLKARWDGRPT